MGCCKSVSTRLTAAATINRALLNAAGVVRRSAGIVFTRKKQKATTPHYRWLGRAFITPEKAVNTLHWTSCTSMRLY